MRKVLDILSVLSFLLVISLTGGTIFGYLWITSEENQEKLKQKVLDSVMGDIPFGGGMTGPALPTKAPTPGVPAAGAAGAIKPPSF